MIHFFIFTQCHWRITQVSSPRVTWRRWGSSPWQDKWPLPWLVQIHCCQFFYLCVCVCLSPMNQTHRQWELCGFHFLQEYLHTRHCIHGNVGARSVLVGGDQTAKLWGLGPAYRQRAQANAPEAVDDMELKKWQAPEVLSRRTISPSSDVWVYGPYARVAWFRMYWR